MNRKKRLSQNFLTDPNIAEKIVRLSEINENDCAIEIGCGEGMLTKFLLATGAEVHGVEVDRDLWEPLKKRFSSDELFTLHESDFMSLDLTTIFSPVKRNIVIGNIPYHITTPILFRCLEYRNQIRSIVLMMQREVAERIMASPGVKAYGILSVLCGLYADSRILFHISPLVFSPKPNVESSVLRLDLKTDLPLDFDYQMFHTVVRTSFNQRRKMLRNSIRLLLQDRLPSFDLEQRPEQLSVDDFIHLTNCLKQEAVTSVFNRN
jgi:16S rRNA (adenine1518-N6/adenine1519-N6)-dimethyltransferase